jgi:hypothetical protein
VDKIQLVSQPTLFNKESDTIFSIVHKPSTDADDLLIMGMHLAVHGATCGILSNLYTGQVVKITLSSNQHLGFIQEAIHAKLSTEDDLPDPEFIRRFEL